VQQTPSKQADSLVAVGTRICNTGHSNLLQQCQPEYRAIRNEATLTADTSSTTPLLSAVAAILSAIAWPTVAGIFLLLFRVRIGSLLDILSQKLAAATKVKAWQIELESTAEDIQDVVKKAGDSASPNLLGAIPNSQIRAAEEVRARIQSSPLPDRRALPAVREQLYDLIHEYDQVRLTLPSGFARSKKMTTIVAGMRALSLAAQPLLTQLMAETTSGGRLAAICLLQMAPDPAYLDWLSDRLKNEDQAFVLFQAALALLELIQSKKYDDAGAIRDVITDGITVISSHEGGAPDANTLQILQTALSKLQ
jgi:hypothetical protein